MSRLTIKFPTYLKKSVRWILCILTFGMGNMGWAQQQNITVHGHIYNPSKQGLAHTKVTIFFNNSNIGSAHTDINGYYSISYTGYGKIKWVEISTSDSCGTYSSNETVFIPESGTLQYGVNYKTDRKKTNLVCRYRNVGSYTKWDSYQSTQDRMFRTPYGTFAYFKPGSDLPIIYHKKTSYTFKIVDEKNNCVPNAYVGIKVKDEDIRWGLTDKNGVLTLYADYPRGILEGQLIFQAKGYKGRHLHFQHFNLTNSAVFRLKKSRNFS